MAELVHLAENFINAENAIIAKKRKRAERIEANPTRHSEQGLVQRWDERKIRKTETTRRQIGQNVEVYVDDMPVKSLDEGSHLDDLQETFETLRNAIKAEALVDFIAEFTPSYEKEDEKEDNKKWVIHKDGSSTLHARGIRVVLQSPEGDKLKHKVRLQYQTTNNKVECKALLKGLELAKSLEVDSILVLGDSQLVIGQVNGTCEAKEDRMKRYLKKVVHLIKKFKEADFIQIPKKENMEYSSKGSLHKRSKG
ncbi:uncharacterized protein LOC136061639 [Quercus suber]|uniref:uncharacterized protein LOC136061639 n=1 Tax=Quercus suber TaxID=58331 RepID=UPI0032DE7101